VLGTIVMQWSMHAIRSATSDVVIGAEEEEDVQELEGQVFQEVFRRLSGGLT